MCRGPGGHSSQRRHLPVHRLRAAPGLRPELRNAVLEPLFYGFVRDQGCQRASHLPGLLEKPDWCRLPGQNYWRHYRCGLATASRARHWKSISANGPTIHFVTNAYPATRSAISSTSTGPAARPTLASRTFGHVAARRGSAAADRPGQRRRLPDTSGHGNDPPARPGLPGLPLAAALRCPLRSSITLNFNQFHNLRQAALRPRRRSMPQ